MALFIPGKTRCVLTGRVLGKDDGVGFRPFCANERDPLYVFSDAVIHRDVLVSSPLARSAMERSATVHQRGLHANSRCDICGIAMTHLDEITVAGHLTDNIRLKAHSFNYARFHTDCLTRSEIRSGLRDALNELIASGEWSHQTVHRCFPECFTNTNRPPTS